MLVQDIQTGDWSEEVAPFWEAVMWSALSWEGFSGLFRAGWKTIKVLAECACASRVLYIALSANPCMPSSLGNSGASRQAETSLFFAAAQGAVVMPLMKRGFSIGLIKFNLITARKP